MFYSLLRIKKSYGFRRLGMQHDLFVMLLYCFLWSVFAINTCDCTYLCLLCVLYCSEVGRFRVGVGLGAPIKVHIYIKWFLFFTNTCKPLKGKQPKGMEYPARQKGVPCVLKNDANGIPWASKSDTKGSWPLVVNFTTNWPFAGSLTDKSDQS